VQFRCPAGVLALPLPARGDGPIEILVPFLNLPDRNDFILVASWLLGALLSRKSYPLWPSGEQVRQRPCGAHRSARRDHEPACRRRRMAEKSARSGEPAAAGAAFQRTRDGGHGPSAAGAASERLLLRGDHGRPIIRLGEAT
jgi:hypothetical protein